ncbi:MAG: hypothetical protein ACYCPT_11230 [Acidimicrobiales bacterium]
MTMFKFYRKKTLVSDPAFYARPTFLRRSSHQQWWTVLHPPYTLMHLSFVVIGACLVGPTNAWRLIATLFAFFLAVGVGAHALDELHGRPLSTSIPQWQLVLAAVTGLGGAVAFGIDGVVTVSAYLTIFIVAGVTLALAYNLELFHARFHTDIVFALSWGGFPFLTAYFAQHGRLGLASLLGAAFVTVFSRAQRQLSSPARALRRRTLSVEGRIVRRNQREVPISRALLLHPLEAALSSLCWSSVILALAFAWIRFHT